MFFRILVIEVMYRSLLKLIILKTKKKFPVGGGFQNSPPSPPPNGKFKD